MKKDNKILRSIFAAFGAIVLILSGSFVFGNKEKAEGDSVSNSGNDDKVAVADAPQTNLAVSANRCRGCGKCAQIDPEHFALDVENRIAIVISSDNLSSKKLTSAEKACYDGAIIIS
ncbi:MAG: ferredoxin [Candidatus Pacebacteria bacterium]|jgi:ferredoxin|nr:ferredoxin [Candidatus Paceibacterota bacterium]